MYDNDITNIKIVYEGVFKSVKKTATNNDIKAIVSLTNKLVSNNKGCGIKKINTDIPKDISKGDKINILEYDLWKAEGNDRHKDLGRAVKALNSIKKEIETEYKDIIKVKKTKISEYDQGYLTIIVK